MTDFGESLNELNREMMRMILEGFRVPPHTFNAGYVPELWAAMQASQSPEPEHSRFEPLSHVYREDIRAVVPPELWDLEDHAFILSYRLDMSTLVPTAVPVWAERECER